MQHDEPRRNNRLWILGAVAVLAACGGKAVKQESSAADTAGTGATGGTGGSVVGGSGGSAAVGGSGGTAGTGGTGGTGGSAGTGGSGGTGTGGTGGSGGAAGTGGTGGAAGTGGTGGSAGTGGTSSGFKCHCRNWTDDAYPKVFWEYPNHSCVIQGCPDGKVCCASSCLNSASCWFRPETFNKASCDPDAEYNDCCKYVPTTCVFPNECAEDGVLEPRPQTSADTLHYCNGIK